MSRREIEQRTCDRCGTSENFDEKSTSCARKKLWGEVMVLMPRERAHDLCPKCVTQLDRFFDNCDLKGEGE